MRHIQMSKKGSIIDYSIPKVMGVSCGIGAEVAQLVLGQSGLAPLLGQARVLVDVQDLLVDIQSMTGEEPVPIKGQVAI